MAHAIFAYYAMVCPYEDVSLSWSVSHEKRKRNTSNNANMTNGTMHPCEWTVILNRFFSIAFRGFFFTLCWPFSICRTMTESIMQYTAISVVLVALLQRTAIEHYIILFYAKCRLEAQKEISDANCDLWPKTMLLCTLQGIYWMVFNDQERFASCKSLGLFSSSPHTKAKRFQR